MSDQTIDTITIDLEGGDDFDPRAVADAIIAIESIVKSFNDHGRPELSLRHLSIGSAHVKIAAPSADVDTLRDGLAELSQHPMIPHGWSRRGVQALVDLGRVSHRRGVEEVKLGLDGIVSRIDSVIQANAERALAPASIALGAVRGILYRYTNDETTSHRTAALRDYRTEEVVSVVFAADLAGQFKQSLDAEVEVWGEVARDQEGRLLKIRAEGIEILDNVAGKQGADSVLGLFGTEWTGGLDPADWVRAQRD